MAVEVLEDGRLVVAGQRQLLAGSGATTGDCIAGMIQSCGISPGTAVRMATSNPGKLLQEPISAIEPGEIATLSVFHIDTTARYSGKPAFSAVATYVSGERYNGLLQQSAPNQI